MALTARATHADVPGLAVRRIAAGMIESVLRRHRALDELLDTAAADRSGLPSLAERDRALVRALVGVVLRRLGTPAALETGREPAPPRKNDCHAETEDHRRTRSPLHHRLQ